MADGCWLMSDARRPMPDVVVLGMGNPLAGDDGVGVALAEALAEAGPPPGASVRVAGSDPLAILEELLAGRRVLLLDACRFGGRPGETTWLRLDDPRWPVAAAPLSLHGLDLPAVFELARALRLPLERAWLLGIEPEGTPEGRGLSPAITESWPRLVDGAHRAVRRLLDEPAPTTGAPAPTADGVAATRGA